MRFLRTVSTRRLLALIAAVVVVAAGGTAIAIAATDNGPVPHPTSLPNAIHTALSAKPVDGISAQISFTNNLISSSNIETSDPIITGATGRLWVADDALRLELQSDNGDAQIVVDHGSFWIYDPSTNTVYKGTLPSDMSGTRASSSRRAASSGAAERGTVPSVAQISSQLSTLAAHLNISRAILDDVGGAAAYRVKISPKHDGGLLGEVQLAWDATHGVPLDFAIYAAGNGTPVLELKVTGISYGPIGTGSGSPFDIAPPADATVVKVATPSGAGATSSAAVARARTHGKQALRKDARAKGAHEVTGASAVAAALPFAMHAPTTLDGLPRRSVELLDWGKSPAALVLYGQGLGGVAVIEHKADSTVAGASSSSPSASNGPGGPGGGGLSLPTVSINGATGQELDTALGTAIEFTRAGVSYVVIGSVPAVAAEAAARAVTGSPINPAPRRR